MAQGVPGRLRPRISLTFRHYKGGRSSAKRTDRLYPRRNPWYSLSEAESTSGHMVLTGVPGKKSPVTQPGIDPGTVRLAAQRLNQYATPGLSNVIYTHQFLAHLQNSAVINIGYHEYIPREAISYMVIWPGQLFFSATRVIDLVILFISQRIRRPDRRIR